MNTIPFDFSEEHSAMSRDNGAEFDDTGAYRLRLWRTWDRGPFGIVGYACWVMLNPSTADHTVNDQTIRKCIAFAKLWGFGGIEVVNVFALRSTDPKALYHHPDPVGPVNDTAIVKSVAGAGRVIAAWGNHGMLNSRGKKVRRLIAGLGDIECLGVTKEGQPKHPLYIPYSVEPVLLTSATPAGGA